MFPIRDANLADLDALVSIRNTPDLFDKYLREAVKIGTRFLVYAEDGNIQGFGRLKFRSETSMLKKKRPIISDLYVVPRSRSKGIGSALIAVMEHVAINLGYTRIYIGVDPVENPRAFSLYRKLGYIPLQNKPYRTYGTFHDEDGSVTEKVYWRVDLVKQLRTKEKTVGIRK